MSERETASYNPLDGSMEHYSLPFFDLPGITSVQDLADPAKAKATGQALFDRWYRGDTPTNLSLTSLMTNAFLLTGDEKYRDRHQRHPPDRGTPPRHGDLSRPDYRALRE